MINLSKIICTGTVIILISFLSLLFCSSCGLYYYEDNDSGSSNKSDESNYGDDSYADNSYKVIDVIDGDTIIIDGNETIRLIGINTPEEDMYFYLEAKEALELIINDKKIVLEKDVSDTDKYGRLLRYVFLEDLNGLFVNLEMVKRGFANAYTYPPDLKYNEYFLEAEKFARENGCGLWEKSVSDVIGISLNCDAEGNDNENLNDEYIILENISKRVINLKGWTIKDSGTNIYRFGNYILQPGSKVYVHSGEGKDNLNYLYWNSRLGIWNNDHDTAYIRDKDGLLVQIYNY